MLEATTMCFLAWLLLAATAFRYRRDLGIVAPSTIRTLRLIAMLVLAAALFHCGAPLTGERFVRFLGAAAIAGAALVMLLSFRPAETMQPIRMVLKVVRRRPRWIIGVQRSASTFGWRDHLAGSSKPS
jgi:hypothetical protein